MKKKQLTNCFKFAFSAGLLFVALPAILMAQHNQARGYRPGTDTPHVSKRSDTIRKRSPEQIKKIMVNRSKNIDHMPIAKPDMKQFNMPIAGKDSLSQPTHK